MNKNTKMTAVEREYNTFIPPKVFFVPTHSGKGVSRLILYPSHVHHGTMYLHIRQFIYGIVYQAIPTYGNC